MPKQFHDRHFPVRPNLEQLRHQAKDLLRAIRRGDAEAVEQFQKHTQAETASAKLADAQFALARSYGLPNWPRLVTACHMTDAIWRGDVEAVRALITKNPELMNEAARGLPDSNWGPPMSYAANVGQDAIIAMLREKGASDVQHAFDRACLQGKIETARKLFAMGARPSGNSFLWTCETLNDRGMEFLLELGTPIADASGSRLAPVALLLETYSRYPQGKHRCLELVAAHGIELPDTPTMAVHRGRIDLLEKHLRADPELVRRTFSLDEIFPLSLGCHTDHTYSLHATPLEGATLLHMCVEYDEWEIAEWLLSHGADVNARAAVDAEGFGGHTPLFNCVVNGSYVNGRQREGEFARMLLDRGADPNARASLHKALRFVPDQTMHEYRNVTPLGWGKQFHGQLYYEWVSKPAMKLIAERGGGE